MLTDDGPLRIDVPRDREGEFEPRLIGKHERQFTGFDDKIIALYARGITVREIQGFLAENRRDAGLHQRGHRHGARGSHRLSPGYWSRYIRWSSSTRCG